ncbi:MAG: alpha/beta hydrolase [Actinobacteria bacterium]|nr:MAG: alpha/beta hydrolase [Actinomycetota bacterium]
MRGLQPPPKRETPSRIVARMAVLIVLLFLFSVTVWAAVTNQQIPLVEDLPLDAVALEDSETSEGIRFNVDDQGSSDIPVFLFHDVEISGSVMFDNLLNSIDGEVRTVAVDLPGFGLTTRIPSPGIFYTVRDMGERVSAVVEARSDGPAVLVGVGLGGKVAAEIAATRPELVAGLMIIDTDFYGGGGWVQLAERIPFVGRAMTYAFEVSGPLSGQAQAPYCEEGGWCPSPDQVEARAVIAGIAGTTYSLHGFRNTTPAANVPSLLEDITAPTIYVWSEDGPVPESSVERFMEEFGDAELESFDVFQAVQESSGAVADLVVELAG